MKKKKIKKKEKRNFGVTVGMSIKGEKYPHLSFSYYNAKQEQLRIFFTVPFCPVDSQNT